MPESSHFARLNHGRSVAIPTYDETACSREGAGGLVGDAFVQVYGAPWSLPRSAASAAAARSWSSASMSSISW